MLAAASMGPLISGFVSVVIFRVGYGDIGGLVVGTGVNYIGLAVALSAGCTVMSVRTFARLRREGAEGSQLRDALRQENQVAAFIAVLGVLVVCLFATTAHLFLPATGGATTAYLLSLVPWIASFPISNVLFGAMQAYNRDKEVLFANIIIAALQAGATLAIVLLRPSLIVALCLLGASQALISVGVLCWRARLVSRTFGVSIRGTYAPPWKIPRLREIGDRALAGVDGLVFMMVFLIATYVAMTHSVSDGAAVALIVSFMRLVVIPLKQFGLVAGRSLLLGGGDVSSARESRQKAFLPCLIAGIIAAALAMIMLPEEIRLPIALMVFGQLLVEPFAGIAYALAQVQYGPATVAPVLFAVYGGVVPVIFLVLVLTGTASALPVWAALFAGRLLFASGVSIVARRAARQEHAHKSVR